MQTKKINYLNIKKTLLVMLLSLSINIALSFKTNIVYAQDIDFSWLRVANVASGGSTISKVEDLLGPVVNIFLGFALAMSVVAIIRAGIKYTMAKGDVKATIEARQALTYSIFAFILAAGAFTVMKIILTLSGAGTGGDQIYLQDQL